MHILRKGTERSISDLIREKSFNFRPAQYSDHKSHLTCIQGTPTDFKKWANEFSAKMNATARAFAIAMAVALNVPYDYFLSTISAELEDEESENIFRMAKRSVIRLAHYPPCTFKVPLASEGREALRVGEHTDFGLFTLLIPDGPGLQIELEPGRWVSPILSGKNVTTAVVNTGAMLARWTNDMWKATNHRVLAEDPSQAARSRTSLVLFVNPREDTIIKPHDNFLRDNETPKYKPISAEQYLTMRLVGINAGTNITNSTQ